MLVGLTMFIALGVHKTTLIVSPWTGKSLPTAVATAAAKSRLSVTGTPGATLTLSTKNVADGWLPAFCTPTVCAPVRVTVVLPASGTAIYQFELIRETQDARKRSGATIVTSDGASAVVPSVSR